MRDVLEQIDAWRAQGEEMAVATVISAEGSTPRPVGARMIVTRTGKMHGSVSGGCVEGAVLETALNVLDTKRPQLVQYGITDEMAVDVGLACGGTIEVFVEPLDTPAAD